MITVIATGKDSITVQYEGKIYEIDEEMVFKCGGQVLSKADSFRLLHQICVGLKEAQKMISAKETEIFALKSGEETSPIPSPPKAVEAAKRKGVSLVNPRLKK